MKPRKKHQPSPKLLAARAKSTADGFVPLDVAARMLDRAPDTVDRIAKSREIDKRYVGRAAWYSAGDLLKIVVADSARQDDLKINACKILTQFRTLTK